MIVLRRFNRKIDQRSTFLSRSAVDGEVAINQSTGHVRGRGRGDCVHCFPSRFHTGRFDLNGSRLLIIFVMVPLCSQLNRKQTVN